jgi:hypothetical protein
MMDMSATQQDMVGLMKLFDDKEQDRGTGNVQTPKSSFAFVNDDDPWTDTPDIRRKCESWFEHIPPKHRPHLRSSFRSARDSQHNAAFFELFLHEMFIQLGCHVEMEPNVSGQTPDFRVSQDGKTIYVEATTVGQTSNPFYRSRNEQDVIDELNLSLSSPHFFIGVDMEGTLKRTLGRGWVPSKFKKLLDAHDPKDVQSLIDKGGLYAAPSERIECGDWTLTGWLVPALEDIQCRVSERPIVIEPYRARFLDPISSVRRALYIKAKKYSRLEAPLAIAVNALNPFYSPLECDSDVLWGNRSILSEIGPNARTQYVRQPNGFWSSKNNGGTAAVLMFKHTDMLNMFQASVCLHVNPRNSSPRLPDALFRLPHFGISEGVMKRREGEDIAQLLGVGWK